MFVATNSVEAVIHYFQEQLNPRFTHREIQQIAKSFICERFEWTNEDFLLNRTKTKCSESDLLYFRSVVKRMLTGEPYQYVFGKVWFYDLELFIQPGALIPRPETEELVDWILEEEEGPASKVVIDLGTGSGCIPIALKANRPQDRVSAVDVSEEVLELARKNAEKHQLEISFVNYDLLSDLEFKLTEKADVIVSNPPYIPESERLEMADHVVNYEPEKALFVPQDNPLLFYERILLFSERHLKPKGTLYLEIHEHYAQELKALLIDFGHKSITLRKDLQGKDRMIRATR